MTVSESQSGTVSEPAVAVAPAESDEVIESDSLVEEVSIDGMCGVY